MARRRTASQDVASTISRTVDTLFEYGSDAAESAREFLASEEGRELRRRLATAVIVGAPLLSGLPMVRRTPLGRLLQTAAVGTLLVKGAEWIRDWEPERRPYGAR